MVELLLAWAGFPLALIVLSLGCGLLLERAAGGGWPGSLLLPGGFTLILALGYVLTSFSALAPLAMPVMVVAAAAGFVLGRRRLRQWRPRAPVALAALGVFVVFGAPIFLSGEPSFAGALALPDTSHQLVLAERLPEHGHEHVSLPNSTYQATVYQYLNTRYPAGAQATLGALRPFGFQDVAWLYQPFLSFMAAMAALAVSALLVPWVRRAWLRALAGFLAAQPALVVGYALQGSIKEVGAVCVYWTACALLAWAFIQPDRSARMLAPAGVACVALLGVLGPTAAVYLVPPVAALAVAWGVTVVRGRQWRQLGWAAAGALLAGVALLPAAAGLKTAYEVNSGVLSQSEDLGNLAAPLKLVQASGVWLAQDFRYAAAYPALTLIAQIAVALLGALGVYWCVRRRAVGPAVAIGSLVLTAPVLLAKGSPYADGKVLMLVTPAVVLAAALGGVFLIEARPRLRAAGYGLLAVVAAGVLASNALAYRGVQAAPHDRYAELLDINDEFAGSGPAFFNEYDEFAGYFLRDVRPFAAPPLSAVGPLEKDPARRPNAVKDKLHRPSVKAPFDIDDMTNDYLQSKPLMVLRRSATVSRPPANFQLARAGRYYDVWRRQRGLEVTEHLPLGANALDPGGIARCSQVRSMAARARRAGARLAYVRRPLVPRVFPFRRILPDGWFEYGAYPRSVVPDGPGVLTRSVTLPKADDYRVWIEGSFGRPVSVRVDGREVGTVSGQSGNPGQLFPLSTVRLRAGLHRVELHRAGGSLAPGNGDNATASLRHIGPVVFSPSMNERPRVQTLAPGRASELCGLRLDWIEIARRR